MARRKKNSAKVNLVLSVAFHGLAIMTIFFFAAREGLVGKKLQEITATLVSKAKPAEEKPKPPPEPIPEPPKDEPKAQVANTPPPESAPPPAQSAPAQTTPAIAPAAAIPADFSFDDGAKIVETSTNAQVDFYKNYVEYTLRSHWARPEGVPDEDFVAELSLNIDKSGKISSYSWKKNSGNKTWDNSVEKALKEVKSIGRLPPTNFPPTCLVRFDVVPATEPAF